MTHKEELINMIESAKQTGGKKSLLKYLKGEKLNLPAMIKAKCCECMGYYEDGKMDCEIPTCPLYPRMPYRNKENDPPKPPSNRGQHLRGKRKPKESVASTTSITTTTEEKKE
jgi:hypothetical protein